MSFYTAARDGQIDLLLRYLADGVDIHQRFNDDRTALHFACDGGNFEVVKLLLQHKADVNLPDVFNKDTPLHLAAEAGHTEIVRLLIEHGSDVNVQDQMNGETPLHLACEGGFTDIVELLLKSEVDLSIENVYKKTALHYANEGSANLIRAYQQRTGQHLPPPQQLQAPPARAHAGAEEEQRSPARRGANGGGSMAARYAAGESVSAQHAQLPSSYVAIGSNRKEAGDAEGLGLGRQNSPSPELYGEGAGWGEQSQEELQASASSWYAAWSLAGQASDGRDKPNQDSFIIVPMLGGDPDTYLFGLFDGHGRNGHLVAAFAKSNLAQLLPSERIRGAAGDADADGKGKGLDSASVKVDGIPALLADACSDLQTMLEQQKGFDVSASGCTALVALLVKNMLYVANVGDSRAVLAHVSNPKAQQGPDREQLTVLPLTADQVPGLKEERERIEDNGGQVRRDESTLTGEQGPFRVWRKDMQGPGLAMARSLGDTIAHEIGVTHLPTIREYRVSESDRMLLMATDGIWDMLENGEAVDIAARASGDCKCDPSHAAEQLCDTARRAWEFKEARIDDITALLVFLPPPLARPPRLPDPAASPAGPTFASPTPQRFSMASPAAAPPRPQEGGPDAMRSYEEYVQMAQGDLERRAMPWRGGAEGRPYGADLYDDSERGPAAQQYQGSGYGAAPQVSYQRALPNVGYAAGSGYQPGPYGAGGQYQGGGYAGVPSPQQGGAGRGVRPQPQPQQERGLFDGFPGLNLGGVVPREPGQKEEDCVVQ